MEIGELITLKASVNYVGMTSMIVGIRVTSQNIQTGKEKHTNSSYFTMVAKDEKGNNVRVPKLILSNLEEVRRFYEGVERVNQKTTSSTRKTLDYASNQAIENLKTTT